MSFPECVLACVTDKAPREAFILWGPWVGYLVYINEFLIFFAPLIYADGACHVVVFREPTHIRVHVRCW